MDLGKALVGLMLGVDNKKAFVSFLTDLSKVSIVSIMNFDCKTACIQPITVISEISSWLFSKPQTEK